MSLKLKVFEVLKQYISRNSVVIVGVSGGPDSVCLLRLLVEFSKIVNCKIVVAHINHGLRGKDAFRDEQFVKSLSKKYGVKCFVKRVKISPKSRTEEEGRNARRAFFEALRDEQKAEWILTAHTQDDQVETIVFNFIRGSGIAGLAGMKTKNGFFFKPLLDVPKKEILGYLRQQKLDYSIDYTNDYTKFSRNFIRKKILPLMEKLNPSFRRTLTKNTVIFSELDEWISHFSRGQAKNQISLKDYEQLPTTLKFAVIQDVYRAARKTPYRLPVAKVQEVTHMLSRRIGKKRIQCPGGITFSLHKGIITLSREKFPS